MINIKNRTIFCHDNLEVLQGINSESIDLIYLDPPFNKKKTFTAPIGSTAEGASFKDIFTLEDIKEDWVQSIKEDYFSIYSLLEAVKNIEGRTSYNFCYLTYMAVRLIQCHRVLKHTGSLYLHCDPTMSHYLKILLDCIFDEKNFRNEIVWCYSNSGRSKASFTSKHDIIFSYGKSEACYFDYTIPVSKKYLDSHYRQKDKDGKVCRIRIDAGKERIYYPEEGVTCNDWWADIPSLNSVTKERTGYPTQKPIALLERIIKASSNKGDVILDPFCGCATTCVTAEKLDRKWIGIDISHKAYELVKDRLNKEIEADLFDWNKEINFKTSPPKRSDDGEEYVEKKYVYVITHKKYPGEYKVGIASNVKSRLNSYQTSAPDRSYELQHSTLTPYFREIEKYIHEKYENNHEWVRGELEDIVRDIEGYTP